MPLEHATIHRTDTEVTLLKFVDTEIPRQPKRSTCSLTSDTTSVFSERSGSTVLLYQAPCRCGARNIPSSDSSSSEIRNAYASLHSHNTSLHSHNTSLHSHNTTSRRLQSTRTLRKSVRERSRHQHHTTNHQPLPHTHQPFLSRRCLFIIAMISLTSSVISSGLAILCCVYNIVPAQEDNTFKNGDYDPCIPCFHLRGQDGLISSLADQLVIRMTPQNEEVCCARNSGQMSTLLQTIMNKQRKITVGRAPVKQKFRPSPVSAHRHLWPGGKASQKEDGELKCEKSRCHLQLNADINIHREHAQNVTVRNNSLVVASPGWYLIYSSINFRTESPCSQLPSKTFQHFITRTSAQNSKMSGTLADSAHTCCENCPEEYHTSYIAGVFQLKKKDAILVEVFGSGIVSFDDDTTYLGLVMLGNTDLPFTTVLPNTRHDSNIHKQSNQETFTTKHT